MPQKIRLFLSVLAASLALTTPDLPAQGRNISTYYTAMTATQIAGDYDATSFYGPEIADLNADGHQDFVLLGANFPGGSVINVPQPGRVFLGDGQFHFTPAPADQFPVDTMFTVHPRKVMFNDFNNDGRPDMFVSDTGFDAPPFPGGDNRLYLARRDGGGRDATANLPQLDDYSHSSSAGDVSHRGLIDIFVGNGYPGLNQIRPYFLLNTGSGQFAPTTSNFPGGRQQILDTLDYRMFAMSTIDDLDDDGWPELMVAADSSEPVNRLRRSTIFWNRSGAYVENDITELPVPAAFPGNHIDHDIERMDVNGDGLQDLLIVGRQTIPLRGWFLQILINRGNRQFVDETAERVPAGKASAGVAGAQTETPIAYWVKPLDFNQDGVLDFFISVQGEGIALPRDQPLVYINDGTGHFSTYNVEDLVSVQQQNLIGGAPKLILTKNGYSFIGLNRSGASLSVKGLLANEQKLPGVGR
jgi:hypothetical protein